MAKKVFDAAVSNGEYTDAQGNQKKRWMNVGVVFENDNGQLSMKMEAVPVGPDWSGWISFFPPKDKQQPRQETKPGANVPASEYDDDVGF